MTLKAIIHDAEEGGFWAEVPALPGCVTQAETKEELEVNLHEAIEGWFKQAKLNLRTILRKFLSLPYESCFREEIG
ncbi:MAG: type II toxin-antitoxin system HicB family antitoxin [Verrucomicrobiales bacterium]|nr:type II toxin-antitoxin system HicB family antitoxin [Verrucomicrobiales bacterium]